MSSVIGALRVNLGLDSAAFNRGLGAAQTQLSGFQKTLIRAGRQARAVGRNLSIGVTAPVVAGFGGVLKSAGDFEKSMNRVKALSGATGRDFKELGAVARELGSSTQYSASQAADAMGFLAMAGFDANEIIGAMPSTLQLAAAAGADLGTSADIVSNILTGFGREVGDLAEVNDVLVKTLSSSNTDLRMLGDAMKYVGPVASSAGMRFNEVAAAVGLLGNAGIQGEMAGTALRGMMSRLLNPTKQATDAITQLGVELYKPNGQLKDLAGILQELQPHADDTAAIMEIFGQRAGPAVAALLSQGSDGLREFERVLANSSGVAASIAATQMEGFNGALVSLKSALEGLAIAIADSGLLEWATRAVTAVTAWVRSVSESNPALFKWGVVIAGVAAALGPLVAGIGLTMAALAPLAGAIMALISPLGLLAAGVTAAAGAIYANWDSLKESFPAIAGIIEGALDGLLAVFGRLSAASEILVVGIVGHFRLLGEMIEALLTGDLSGALDAGSEIVRGFGRTVVEILRALVGDIADAALNIGHEIVAGIQRGLKEKWQGLKDSVVGMGSGMKNWLKKELRINSPSKVFQELGQGVVEGLVKGIDGGSDLIKGAASGMSDALSFGGFVHSAERAESAFTGIGEAASGAFGRIGQLFAEGVRGATSLREALGGVLKSLGQVLLRQAQTSLTNAFGGSKSIGGSIVSGLFSGLMGFATGTPYAPGGLSLVGERGPELVDLPRGARVLNANVTRGAMGGGQNITFAPVIDARGADAGAVARIEQSLQRAQVEFETRVIGTVRGAQRKRLL